VVTILDVPLPGQRDQISTKELPEFIRLRGEVARLIRHPRDAQEPVAAAAG
jgi:NitT/TauT family transport system ATP-binding protein